MLGEIVPEKKNPAADLTFFNFRYLLQSRFFNNEKTSPRALLRDLCFSLFHIYRTFKCGVGYLKNVTKTKRPRQFNI